MDSSSQNLQPSSAEPHVSNINYTPLPPQTPTVPQPKKRLGRIVIFAGLAVLIILSVSAILYFYFSKSQATYNASVYTPPKIESSTPTPTPKAEEINKNDNSNDALDNDSKIIDKDINNAGSDLEGVNEGFSDTQTNLQ